jgi:hypothetical protein
LGALILLVGTVIILFSSNVSLAWTAMPILPIAIVLFVIFASISQPLFIKVQGEPGGHQGDQGLYARKRTADKIPRRRR